MSFCSRNTSPKHRLWWACPEVSEIDFWRKRVAAGPNLRIAKVLRIRRALATNDYDEESGLEHALATIQQEISTMWPDKFEIP